jgi:hypothetical protein
MDRSMKFICTTILASFLLAGISFADDLKIGMMNWNTYPITNKNGELAALTDFAGSTTAPSIANGWIIQAAAGSLQDTTFYSNMNAFISQVDPNNSQGHRISLNCSNDTWTHTLPPSNLQSAHCMVNNLLAYISSIDTSSVILHKNVDENGYPTLDINLDIEPHISTHHSTWSSLYDGWLDMIEGVRDLIEMHNNSSPNILVTLSAFIPQVMVVEAEGTYYPMTTAQMTRAWAYFDTLIVMAYRNLPCFTEESPLCTATDPQFDCPDGILNSARALRDTIPQGIEGEGKHFAIALELSRDVGNCDKISFGYNKIYDGSTGLSRQDFLKTAIQQGWDSFSSADQSKLHPDGAFMLHSYESLHCFRNDTAAPGALPANCDIGGTCNPSSGCIPALFTPPPDIYGDVNNDGIVDENDILALEELLGSCRGDLNFDGIVNVHDILMTIGNWGACP